ncbi:uncharacterized protein N7506_006364 [Penicillium brevicompactum]|uniref:uncharacterized protein n=1 Tax=Penicillium brevicompactum TaxID=5074 RepID=UPI002541B090|nr:uncharacterized protein N7506_006364 [Penicillium brevicompactum]KAJ5332581.1 hypothetical protein N7506_006364 [Penicillium brevicompactum]
MDDELVANISLPPNSLDTTDPLFYLCWRRQSCSSCLSGTEPCSWCAISSTCVPNTARVPIFAPIGAEGICPLGSKERWELRTQPFGCHASTLTVLSVLVAVLGTVALGGIGVLLVWFVRRVRRRWKEMEYEGLGPSKWRGLGFLAALFPSWGRRRQIEEEDGEEDAETRPLLE